MSLQLPQTPVSPSPSPSCLAPFGVLLDAPSAENHPGRVYLARLAPGSRPAMAAALERMARVLSGSALGLGEFPWAEVRYQHAAALRARLAAELAPATTNKYLAALRGVLREAWRLGALPAEAYHRAIDLAPVRGSSLPAGRALEEGEVRALFAACAGRGAAGARDAALLGILYGCGLRRTEAVGLGIEDYDPRTSPGPALRVRHAKGAKERLVYPPQGSVHAIAAWLQARGADPGALLCAVNKGGRVRVARITGQAVLAILQRVAARAGVARFSPHDLRRSHISQLLDHGADLLCLQALLGHQRPQTTARYDRRGEASRRRTAELLHVPYVQTA